MQHWPACAHLGVGQLGREQLNVYEAYAYAEVGEVAVGTAPGVGLMIEGATVNQVLNEAPDTASFRARGFTPIAGQAINVYGGAVDVEHQLFSGRILETTQVYEGRKENVAFDLQCIDSTWLLNRRKVLATYVGFSASNIVVDIMVRFTGRIGTAGVAPNLPIIDAITFTNEDVPACLSAVCERIGAFWYVDYASQLHVALTTTLNAETITDAEPRGSANHTLSEDLSQVVTRVIGRGGGVGAAIDVPIGMTELPVDEGDQQSWYATAGGLVEVNTQVIQYAGVKGRGGVGALVGTGNTPTSPLSVHVASGTGLGSGTYQYAQTFANATGETTSGPVATIQTGFTVPSLKKIAARNRGVPGYPSGMTPGGIYSWRVAILYEGVGFVLGPPTDAYVVDGNVWELGFGIATLDPATGFYYNPSMQDRGYANIVQTQVYRTVSGGSTYYAERSWPGVVPTSTGWETSANNWTDSVLVNQPQYPTGPLAQFNAARVIAPIASPPAGFTSTNLYRTAVGGSQLKLLVANVATGTDYVDTKADGALGANVPTSDSSGIVAQSNVTVPAGATSILVTSTVPFANDGGASGGWARVGGVVIRYGGLSGGNTLTGIPASGLGSLTASVRYGTQALVQPRLVGIPAGGAGSVVTAIRKGDQVTIRIERQNDAAVAAFAERIKPAGGTAVFEDGIVESVISDSRYTLAELGDHVDALLLERKDPRLTVTFESRDPSLQVGRTITIAITTPPITGTFRIQRVGISQIAIGGATTIPYPLRHVEATNKLYTFTDLLRQLRGREAGVP